MTEKEYDLWISGEYFEIRKPDWMIMRVDPSRVKRSGDAMIHEFDATHYCIHCKIGVIPPWPDELVADDGDEFVAVSSQR